MKKCADRGRCNVLRCVILLRNQAMISSHVHKLFRQFLTFRTAKRAKLPLYVASKKTFFESFWKVILNLKVYNPKVNLLVQQHNI